MLVVPRYWRWEWSSTEQNCWEGAPGRKGKSATGVRCRDGVRLPGKATVRIISHFKVSYSRVGEDFKH